MKPTAAPAYFPYAHRTMAEVMAIEAGMERARQERERREALKRAYNREYKRRRA